MNISLFNMLRIDSLGQSLGEVATASPWWSVAVVTLIGAIPTIIIKVLDKKELLNKCDLLKEDVDRVNDALKKAKSTYAEYKLEAEQKFEKYKAAADATFERYKRDAEARYEELRKSGEADRMDLISLRSAVMMIRKDIENKGIDKIPGLGE